MANRTRQHYHSFGPLTGACECGMFQCAEIVERLFRGGTIGKMRCRSAAVNGVYCDYHARQRNCDLREVKQESSNG